MKTITLAFGIILGATLAQSADYKFLAHRGVAQDYHREGLTRDTCTASRMLPPRHGYLENTIASMDAAFAMGAEMVEFDIHPTADGEFVVFHDWTIDCRTDGHGVTREQTLAKLKSLDIGYGYTADGGRTFPFRGKFVGAMPTWAEVMSAFPRQRFLVNVKSNDPNEADSIVRYVERHRIDATRLAFYGGDRPIERLRERWPTVQAMSRATLKECAIKYLLFGWTGYVPQSCRNSIVFVPLDYQGWVWGWPAYIVPTLAEFGSELNVIGPLARNDAGVSTMVDDADSLAKVAPDFIGLVSTDAIDLLGPAAEKPGLTSLDKTWAEWNRPFEPFRIAGNLYYVGSVELASYAIRTPEGLILIDTGLYQGVPQLLQNLRKLGMNPYDVKILLTSHAHADHVGGIATMKRITGAKLVATAPDAYTMSNGGLGDFAFGDQFPFPAVKVDRIIRDGDAVELGGTRLVARVTPGHTEGCTTWTMQVEEGGKRYDVVFGCSYTAPGYKLVGNERYPRIAEDFRATFATLKGLKCDIQLASHASFMDLEARRAKQKAGDALAFVDPKGCRDFIEESRSAFEAAHDRQRRGGGSQAQ